LPTPRKHDIAASASIEITIMKSPSLPTLLSFNGGYVDTLGFLSLSGLFTAHVTGNFVTLVV
jgi:uncharacterized membrane protein YoaK (UPF0700 family)